MHDNDNNTRRQKPEPEENKNNLTPETASVGVQIGKVTSGVLQNRSQFGQLWAKPEPLRRVCCRQRQAAGELTMFWPVDWHVGLDWLPPWAYDRWGRPIN